MRKHGCAQSSCSQDSMSLLTVMSGGKSGSALEQRLSGFIGVYIHSLVYLTSTCSSTSSRNFSFHRPCLPVLDPCIYNHLTRSICNIPRD